MKRKHAALLAIALAVATAGALAGLWPLIVGPPESRIVTSGTAAIGGPFQLVSTNADTVTDQSYRGKWLLIYFGYTFCPDACPTALNVMSVALEKLGQDAGKLQPLFITVDPNRDTREVMSEYLKSFDPRIVGLTGSQDQIDGVVKEYRIYVEQQKSGTEGNDYLVSHSARIYLMDPSGKFANVIDGNETGETIAARLRKEIHRSGR
jgi:protein SCO1/2